MVQARPASLSRPNILFVLADDMGWGERATQREWRWGRGERVAMACGCGLL